MRANNAEKNVNGNSKSTKIIRIIARLNMGGPAKHVSWLSSDMRVHNFETKLVCGTVSAGEVDISRFASTRGVRLEYVNEMSRELSWRDAIAIYRVFQLLRKERPRIMHTHTAKAGTVGRVAAILYWLSNFGIFPEGRCRVVHTYHGHVFHSYYGKTKTAVFIGIERILAMVTDAIIAISEQQKTEINQDFGVGKEHQYHVVPLGLDLEKLANPTTRRNKLRSELDVNDDTILVGIIGRLTEIKNHRLFLDAVAIARSNSPKLRFVVIGDGHLMPELTDYANEINIDDIVTFLGNRDDPEVFFAGVDIVALSSLNEGTPLTLIEAMASSRSVVSTLVGGVGDVLGRIRFRNGSVSVHERGLSVATGDTESLAEAIKSLANDKKLRDEFEVAGKEFADHNYSKDRLCRDMANLYNELIGIESTIEKEMECVY